MADKIKLIHLAPGYVELNGKNGLIDWKTQLIEETTGLGKKTGTTYNVTRTSDVIKLKNTVLGGVKFLAFIDVNARATIDLELRKTYDAKQAFKLDHLTKAAFYLARQVVRRNYLELGGAVFFGFFLNYIIKYAALVTGRPLPW